MTIKVPSGLPSLVKRVFAKARDEGELHYFATQVTVIHVKSIPFQLRFSPSLANKPKGPPKGSSKDKPFDPFEAPPPGLVVTSDLGPEHYLVLNKFAVVPEHFILATRAFKPQTHVLEEDDLAATRACIDGYGGALFAFFNCGEHSGASQPHRHIQLLPVEAMREGLPEDSSWDVLANRLLTDKAPFVTFAEAITADMSSGQLHEAYVRLYQKACRAVALYKKDGLVDDAPATGETKISYNMAMTSTALVVCPRLSEGSPIPTETSTGSVALNGTVLAGTALVKSEAEWEALKGNPDLLHGALEAIGIPV